MLPTAVLGFIRRLPSVVGLIRSPVKQGETTNEMQTHLGTSPTVGFRHLRPVAARS